MNTYEGHEAKCVLFDQLRESELMRVAGVTSPNEFRALGQKLESLRLIDYGPPPEPFDHCEWSMHLTERGAAVLREQSLRAA